MIFDKIEFDKRPFHVALKFFDRISILLGDSGTGKTFLYKAIDSYRIANNLPIVLFNNRTFKFHEMLREVNNSLVIIDHAEEILSYEDKMFINLHKNCQYLIIGRNYEGLFINPNNLLVVNKSENVLSFRRAYDLSLD